MDDKQANSIAEQILLRNLNLTKNDWDKLSDAEKDEKVKHTIESSYKQWQRNNDFISGIKPDLLQGIKPEASSTEILEAYRQNKDWQGELFKIVDRGLSKFFKKHKLKWNDDKRLLFFLHLYKIFSGTLGNPSMFEKSFGETNDLNFLNDDKAVSMVNEMLDIVELSLMSLIKAKRKVEKELRPLRRGKPVREPNLSAYIAILEQLESGKTPKEAFYESSQEMNGTEKQKTNLETSFTNWCTRKQPSIHYTNPKDRKRALRLLRALKK